jgi:antirestriction protein
MKIYIACLASYNNGTMHGEWIDASSDVDEMQEEVARILRGSPYPNVIIDCPICEGDAQHNLSMTCTPCKATGKVPSAEEFAIHDFDGLPSSLGEYCGLQAVADAVEFFETADIDQGLGSDAACNLLSEFHGDVAQATSALEDYCGSYSTFKEYADENADEMIACHFTDGKAPEMLVNYFDYESYARDLKMDMTVIDTATGVMVFHA